MRDIMAGIDLHSNNLVLALVGPKGQRLMHKRLPCELPKVYEALLPYEERIGRVAVESTFNWYWLVDGLLARGYKTVLANPAGIQQYGGIKHTDDKHDAFWLAEMLRLNILPTGWICPRPLRGVRDLLRRRLATVRRRTSLILSLRSLHTRVLGQPLALGRIKKLQIDEAWRLFEDGADQMWARESLRLIHELDVSIERMEAKVWEHAHKLKEYRGLVQIPGIGRILGMTISMETGDIKRFTTAGDFASYARCVKSERSSNQKKKGENNAKCGNKYLSWAFVEAAQFAARYDPQAKAFYERKKARTNTMVATKSLACKLAKAAWHVMKKGVDYDSSRAFGGAQSEEEQNVRPGTWKMSLTQETEVEKYQQKEAGEKITSPVESSQLSGQAALGLRSRRALSSAGAKNGGTGCGPGKVKKAASAKQAKSSR